MAEIILTAKTRTVSSKGDLNQLRRNGIIPGIFYTKDAEPIAVQVTELNLNPLVHTSETHIISLEIEGKEALKGIIKEVQFDPITDRIIHFDLYGVTAGQELVVQVPVILQGTPAGVRDEGGLLQHHMHKLDIACLPRHIPEQVEIDVSGLKIGDSIHVGDLSFENFTIKNPEDVIVASVVVTRAAQADEEVVAEGEIGEEPAEPEVIGKGKSEDEEEKE